MLLKNCAYLVTQNASRGILKNCDVFIEGNRIKKIGKNISVSKTEKIIDCSNKIVLPGLINTHTHLGMYSLKGVCDDKELFDWLAIVGKEEQKLTKPLILENTEQGLREAVMFGITCLYDSYHYAAERVKIFEKYGVRGCVSSTIKTLDDVSTSEKFIQQCCQSYSLVKPFVAAHSIFGTSEKILKEVIRLSEKYGVMRRLHVAETRKERFDVQNTTGKLPIEYLYSLGFLNTKALLVHCIWITKGEIGLLARTNTKVSHNPVSNMKLASGGVMPLQELRQAGVCVGIGTDSVVSNNNLDMFEEMKICSLLQRHHYWDPTVASAQTVLDMATINGALCLGFEKLGSIQEGYLADIITVKLEQHLLPVHDVVSNLVFCAHGDDVNDVIIDGKIVVNDKVIYSTCQC